MRKLIGSAVAAMVVTGSTAFAGASDDDLRSELDALKKELMDLKQTVKKANLDGMKEELGAVKKMANGDNLKLSADYRFSFDKIDYKFANGEKAKNTDLMTNRVLISAKAAPRDDLSFISTFSYNKVFGDTGNHSQRNNALGTSDFDWLANNTASDNTLKIKEAYFLYYGSMGEKVPYTFSVGRRPSTTGLPLNLREGDQPNSPLAHLVNVEFDGMSMGFELEKLTGMTGLYFKLCAGRGLTNAKPRFQFTGDDYAEDETVNEDIDMYGFIFKPYDDGQYSVWTEMVWAQNLIGYTAADIGTYITTGAAPSFTDVGLYHGGTIMAMAKGIGDFWSDFLDDTTVFVSYAYSEVTPDDGMSMLGSTDSERGHSWYAGVQVPCLLTEKGRIGLEYNVGSEYWRSMTYGEDTVIGSKIAARGTAWEAYYLADLLGDKVLTADIRYTAIDYKYAGSNAFFGDDGTPTEIGSNTPTSVDTASDLRVTMRYRY